MADNGLFRNAFRGFNKQDVLQYIDQLQTTAMMNLDAAQLRASAAQTRADELQSALTSQQAAAEEAVAQAAELREQNEKLMALAQVYKRELLQLREQTAALEQAASDNAALEEAQSRVAALERENALLKEQNAQYARVVGDIHRVMMQARVVSASYFETAHKNSLECLGQLDTFLDDLKAQVASSMASSAALRNESGDQIDSLLSELQV